MRLTKEQRMEMVSKAIDAGFDIQLNIHNVKSEAELDSYLSIFDGFKVEGRGSRDHRDYVWFNAKPENKYDDSFRASIFVDSLRGEPNGRIR